MFHLKVVSAGREGIDVPSSILSIMHLPPLHIVFAISVVAVAIKKRKGRSA
jgi:hypothetical protein